MTFVEKAQDQDDSGATSDSFIILKGGTETLRGRMGPCVAAWLLEAGWRSRLLPALGSRFSPLAAACAARKVTIWRLDLPLVGVARPLSGPRAFVGDPQIPQNES